MTPVRTVLISLSSNSFLVSWLIYYLPLSLSVLVSEPSLSSYLDIVPTFLSLSSIMSWMLYLPVPVPWYNLHCLLADLLLPPPVPEPWYHLPCHKRLYLHTRPWALSIILIVSWIMCLPFHVPEPWYNLPYLLAVILPVPVPGPWVSPPLSLLG